MAKDRWHNRSPEYKAKAIRRRNELNKRDYLIGRLYLWEQEGRRDPLPNIRTPVIEAIAIYARHGVTQEMYYSQFGRYIEEPEQSLNEIKRLGRTNDTFVPAMLNRDKIKRAQELVRQSPLARETILNITPPTEDDPSSFHIDLQGK